MELTARMFRNRICGRRWPPVLNPLGKVFMPTRSRAQIGGDAGEGIVHQIVDSHPSWLCRRQDHDFGIDLEAELALSDGENQILKGKLLKLQIKASESREASGGFVSVRLDRDYLEYAAQFRLPVLLIAVDLQSRSAWWVWLQDWLLENETSLAQAPEQKSFAISILIERTLTSGLDHQWKDIALGKDGTSVILAVRELALAATETGNTALLDRALELLDLVDSARRSWAIEKTVDALIGLGPQPWMWETMNFVPQLHAVVDRFGKTMTRDQLLRLVARSDTYSRAGFQALVRLYDRWPEYARSLGLRAAFSEAGVEDLAWYCAAREHYPELDGMGLWNAFGRKELPVTRFGEVNLLQDDELSARLWSKWPTRGDSVLLDNLVWLGTPPDLGLKARVCRLAEH